MTESVYRRAVARTARMLWPWWACAWYPSPKRYRILTGGEIRAEASAETWVLVFAGTYAERE